MSKSSDWQATVKPSSLSTLGGMPTHPKGKPTSEGTSEHDP